MKGRKYQDKDMVEKLNALGETAPYPDPNRPIRTTVQKQGTPGAKEKPEPRSVLPV